MTEIILTQYNGSILGPIAKVLGTIMGAIYSFMDNVLGIQNISLSIILFTIFIYMCMFPLTYKQQKFSKLSTKMNPELQAVNKKYQGKKDQASMAKMQEETQAIYQKYGISPTGGCLTSLIQMPIFFALYRVFYSVPAYIGNVKNIFGDAVNGIIGTTGFADKMTDFIADNKIMVTGVDFTAKGDTLSNYVIDVLNKMGASGWDAIRDVFPNLSDVFTSTQSQLNHVNNFLGLNIAETPFTIIKDSFASGAYLLMIMAFLIPVVSYATQVISIKMMPVSSESTDQMAQQMKTMNKIMPLFSLVMCFTVPVGLGIYWIMGPLIRSVQQFFMNKHWEKVNLDDIIKQNQEKAKKKRAKMGIAENQITNTAKMSTKANVSLSNDISVEEKEEKIHQAQEYAKTAKPGSMAAKANMVRDFNERNNK